MSVKTIDVLRDARRIISDEKRWTCGTFARDENGAPLALDDVPRGVSFCALGAIARAAWDRGVAVSGHGGDKSGSFGALWTSLDVLSHRLYPSQHFVQNVNDFDGRLAAIRVLDAAIAELEASC